MSEMMQYCPTCGKPIYTLSLNTTVSQPYIYGAYCQCAGIMFRFTVTDSTSSMISVIGRAPEKEVPKAFSDAFEDVELQP